MAESHIVTFHKCGSNWFRRLFRDAAEAHAQNIWVAKPNHVSINRSVDRGAHDTLCLYRTAPAAAVKRRASESDPIVLCVRDPKDVLISQYWSWLATHTNNNDLILDTRKRLQSMDQSAGMHMLVRESLVPFCNSIVSWIPEIEAGRVTLLKYEDLLRNFEPALESALEVVGAPLNEAKLKAAKEKYSFKKVTSRKQGEEDQSAHYRKGVAGDWANHFDEALAKDFNDVYGHTMTALGYELA